MKHSLFLLTFVLITFNLVGQEGNYWFFGYGAGIDFTDGTPKVIHGQVYTWEGCAVVSNQNNELLFYTDGISVWNRNHEPMPNGYWLLGNSSSAQSSIIVPKPGDPNLFYIFTTDADENAYSNGLNYSIVDMTLNDGLGDVSVKNTLLYAKTCEKLTAVKHANNKDYWIISHEFDTDAYYVHLLTSSGVDPTPVVTKTGAIHGPTRSGFDAIGLIKSSADGETLVATLSGSKTVEIMNFDKETGVISNLSNQMYPLQAWTYGIEFSPDQTKLYISSLDKLFQLDLTAGNFDDVLNSIVTVPMEGDFGSVGQLQLAPDGKIYAGRSGYMHLGVINNPDATADLCDFQLEGLFLDNSSSGWGLPNSLAINFDICERKFSLGNDRLLCEGETLNLSQSCADCNFLWSDGSTEKSLSIDKAGLYWLEISNETCVLRDSIEIEFPPPLYVNFDGDTTLCKPNVLTLKADQPGATFTWNNFLNATEIQVSNSGYYWVDAYYGRCSTRKVVSATFKEATPFDLGQDIIACSGIDVMLYVTQNWGQVLWSTNAIGSSLRVTTSGTVWAEMSSAYCSYRDSIQVLFVDTPEINLGPDQAHCLGETFVLDAQQSEGYHYTWSTGSHKSAIEISEPGTYSVVVTDFYNQCSDSDAIAITYDECLDDLLIPNVITPNADQKNDSFEIKGADGTQWNLVFYNRWGKIVFETNNYLDDWNAEGFPSGVYYYVLTSVYSGKRYQGSVHVIK
jgi:gliding motility-associated-like protein